MGLDLFTHDFDEEEERLRMAEEAAREVSSGPSSDEIAAMIEQARSEAFEAGRKQGYDEGLEKARKQREERIPALLDNLKEPLVGLLAGQADHRYAIELELGRLLKSLCEKLAPEVSRCYSPERLSEECERIARACQGSRWLEVRCAPSEKDDISAMLASLIGPKDGVKSLHVIGDASMQPSEIAASWHGGNSEFAFGRLYQAVCEKILGHGAQSNGDD